MVNTPHPISPSKTIRTESDALPSAEDYAALLSDAMTIKGVSLWKDAARRLRKNWAAMISLAFLIILSVSAFFTPLLPLQSPIEQNLQQRQYLAPELTAIQITQDAKPIDLAQKLAQFDQLTELKKRRDKATGEEQKALDQEIAKCETQENPIDKLWNKPNWLSRQMIRARVAIFGSWCIPSLCGTDNLGRDTLARLFWGARVSLTVGIVATCVSLFIGISWGAFAGYVGGWVDNVMMRIVDVLYSVPFIFVVIFLMTVLSEDTFKTALEGWGINRIVIFYIVIGAIYWLTMSRVVRGQVISLKNEQFVEAARAIGAGRLRIVFRHVVPNIMSVAIVYLTLTIPAVMLFEAFLSFLGLGVEPPDVSWGSLANDGIGVITPVRIYWWLVLFPGMALGMTLFALNFLGDGLRDALDPRMKNR